MSKRAVKPRTIYQCQACGHVEAKWLGRCPACNEWSSLVEEIGSGGGDANRLGGDERSPVALTTVEEVDGAARARCGLAELDRVLGGGLVAGSLILLGGDPGVGKSTLLAQMLRGLAAAAPNRSVLYATGEESVAQAALRARRVGGAADNVLCLAETDIDRVLEHARRLQPAVLALDSIQTARTGDLESIPGSVAQVRECAGRLMRFAKERGIATIVVGHVTKDGAIAGPKTLEHLVDVVLHFEPDGGGAYRILRAQKNRFGSTQEIGVFEMRGAGLVEVPDPSALLLAERPKGAPGSVVVASADGSRPILVEIQALVAPPANGFARRTAVGVETNRVSLLLAVLAQRATCDVLDRDVFVNVAGGLHLVEPAIDLGIACAVVSAARGKAIDPKTVVFGEVGLAGEVRAVAAAELRLAEAKKLGFARCILPAHNRNRLESPNGLELVAADRLSKAIEAL